jgi:hypothetical protein
VVFMKLARPNVGNVFDLSVSPDQNFFIRAGPNAVLVHNQSYCKKALADEFAALKLAKANGTYNPKMFFAHKRATIVEWLGWTVDTAPGTASFQAADGTVVKGLGRESLLKPGRVNQGGIDWATFKQQGAELDEFVVFGADGKAKLFKSTSPFRSNTSIEDNILEKVGSGCFSGGVGGPWCQELLDAIANSGNAALKKALNDGKVTFKARALKWKLGVGYVK